MAKQKKQFLLDIEPKQLYSVLKPIVSENYRTDQIIQWIYSKKVLDFEGFTNISKDIRGNLESSFTLRSFTNVIKDESILDGTVRYTFRTYDNKYIYAVCLPADNKKTVCISTQVGCPVSCKFCLSGKTKFVRNLSRGEILEEILHIENDIKERVSGILFMGMGEPMLNYKNLTSVIKTLISKKEMNIGKRHITVSSMGIIPAIKNLANEMYGVRFALSLHATDDKQRTKIIPNNFGTTISDLLNVCKYYLKKTSSRVTIEYILLKDFNDTSTDAHRLARLMKTNGLVNPSVQVNLIPYNETNSFDYKTPLQVSILNFKKILKLNGITVNIREPKGLDIGAACGQLGKK
ncbi:23S rRNA (adenine(2503)-C(2))-methyltransferase RlmN [Candidatus Ruminimicrobiellum ovillum]|uniref:23S rRNA (adenine(2503)-C(2))-methyltransferase RlmN n=1 Tax=Candidatus Ruminimicrobiellum ovillum TaxID=1947927 RepID=UPI00355A9F7E